MIKAAIFDFDGTIVSKDILDLVCKLVDKEEESERINSDYHAGKVKGLDGLIKRINLLKGVHISQIHKLLEQNTYLVEGIKECIHFLSHNNIITIITSGNIFTVLEYYKSILDVNYIVGSKPQIQNNRIIGISLSDFEGLNFKLDGVTTILKKHCINSEETIAIGDSPADIELFKFSKLSFAINPKGGIENKVDYVIKQFSEIELILKQEKFI